MAETQALYHLLKELFLLIDNGDRQFFNQHGLTVPRFYALEHIHNHIGLSSQELSQFLLCDKSNTSRLLKALEGEGLIWRAPHEDDARKARIYLTPAGRALYQRAYATHSCYNQVRFGSETTVDAGALLAVLQTLKSRLQQGLARPEVVDAWQLESTIYPADHPANRPAVEAA